MRQGWTLKTADVFGLLPELREGSFDACLCDPPYGLEFMGKEWDRLWEKQDKSQDLTGKTSSPFLAARVTYLAGSKAQNWHQQWAEAVLRVLKPGGFLLAFGGTRTYHRLTCALEDAGFEIRDCLMWLYGQGFPKSLDISKAIDMDACRAELTERLGRGPTREEFKEAWEGFREGVGKRTRVDGKAPGKLSGGKHGRYGDFGLLPGTVTAPVTPAAKLWDGWGTALKPAWEPIVVAMKPLDGSFAGNALKHGAAGINVDGCRIAWDSASLASDTKRRQTARTDITGASYGKAAGARPGEYDGNPQSPSGRWPANVILSHHPECVKVGAKRVKTNNQQTEGVARSRKVYQGKIAVDGKHYGDSDRLETVESWDCHPDCPVGMLDRQSGECPSGSGNKNIRNRDNRNAYGKGLGKGLGEGIGGDAGTASRFFYCAKASKKERNQGLPEGEQNKHPTVKPIKLCQYLATLLLPPSRNGRRRLLVPFAGSGSEMIGALLAGWDDVLGIEREREYTLIARYRLRSHNSNKSQISRRGI